MEIYENAVEQRLADLAARLRQARLDANLTQRELARRAGVSLKTLTNAEDGRNVSLETFLRLLQGLGRLAEVSTILADDGPSPIEVAARRGQPRQRVRASHKDDDGSEWQW